MDEITFKGKEIEIPDVGIKWLPLAYVKLISGYNNFKCEFLVDSGADITLIPKKIGELLNIITPEKKIRELRGIGNAIIPYIIEKIKLEIGNLTFESRVGISLTERIPLVLGRLDVFDYFNIEFRQKEQLTIFKPTKCFQKKGQ